MLKYTNNTKISLYATMQCTELDLFKVKNKTEVISFSFIIFLFDQNAISYNFKSIIQYNTFTFADCLTYYF